MKILIVTKNWLGDILFEIPALEAVRAHFPAAEIVCAAPSRCCEILEAHPAVSRVLIFDERLEHRSLKSRFEFVRLLRREKFSRAYLFHRSRTRAFLVWLAGIRERIGFASKSRWFLTQAVPEPQGKIHQADYFMELVRGSGIPAPEHPPYHFYFSAEEDRKASSRLEAARLKNFVCFHLGANWEPKRWPVEHFAKLAELLFEKWKMPVVLTGGTGDKALADQVLKLAGESRILSFAGETSLGELGAIFKRALFVVSGDSGPMHIASGVGTPVAALFGPTDPDLTGPRGSGEKIILSFVPAGHEVPWYGAMPEEGWLSRLLPEKVLAALEKKNWAGRALASAQAGVSR